jgi:hypothetical protein
MKKKLFQSLPARTPLKYIIYTKHALVANVDRVVSLDANSYLAHSIPLNFVKY